MRGPDRYDHWCFWITPKHHTWLSGKNWVSPQHSFIQTPSFTESSALQEWMWFITSFQFASADKYPHKNLELDRVKVDGPCPFCSGGQVWADNCQVGAAETDDYRLYYLSQAQSTLIQQAHLYLIYESLSLSLLLSALCLFKRSLVSLLLESRVRVSQLWLR